MAKGSFDPPQSRRASAPARNASPSRSSAVEEIWTSWRYAKATAGAERAATIGSFRSAIGLRAVTLGRQIFSRELMRQRRPLQARGMRTVDRIVDEPIEGVSVSDAGSLLSVCKTAFPNLQSKQQTRCLALLPTPRLGSLP